MQTQALSSLSLIYANLTSSTHPSRGGITIPQPPLTREALYPLSLPTPFNKWNTQKSDKFSWITSGITNNLWCLYRGFSALGMRSSLWWGGLGMCTWAGQKSWIISTLIFISECLHSSYKSTLGFIIFVKLNLRAKTHRIKVVIHITINTKDTSEIPWLAKKTDWINCWTKTVRLSWNLGLQIHSYYQQE